MHIRALRHRQTGSAAAGAALLSVGAIVLSGCAQQARVSSAWQDNVSHKQSFAKVLVIGVSPDVNQRCRFEHFMVSRMRSEATTAIASCDAMTKREPLTREGVDLAVASIQADAVVATNLVARDWDAEKGGSRDTRGGAYYKATDAGYATGYYGAYGVPVVYGEFQTTASVTTMQGEVQVGTRVYETRGATLIYTMETKAKGIESSDAGFATIAGSISDRLRRDGLIR